jgi:uncharacterized protein (TIGR03083 family)
MTATTAPQVPRTGAGPRAGPARTALAILMAVGPLAIAVVRGILPYNTTENPGGLMDQDGMWRMVGEERQEILRFLRPLTPAQWQTPSLCAGWRVQDVAVHLLVDEPFRELGWPRGLAKLARMGFSVHRANAWVVQHNAARDTGDIVAIWQRSLPPGPVARLLGAGGCLRAGVIHHQDMRRPLGMPRVIPAERLKGVLDAIITPKGSVNLGSRQRAAGLRLTATDADWAHGNGPRVEGPGEALIMALAGRAPGLAELKGDGLPILQARTRAPGPSPT